VLSFEVIFQFSKLFRVAVHARVIQEQQGFGLFWIRIDGHGINSQNAGDHSHRKPKPRILNKC
jgi:hypothetical protein